MANDNIKNIEKYYQRTEYFDFNLLPKKSLDEIVILNERDNTLLYSMILIFGSIFLLFCFTMLDVVLIKRRADSLQERSWAIQNNIKMQDNIKLVNGEIVRKSRLLAIPLDKDIQLSTFLAVTNDITNNIAEPTDFRRSTNGRFEVSVNLGESNNNLENIMNNAKQNEAIEEPRVETVSQIDGTWKASISFLLTN